MNSEKHFAFLLLGSNMEKPAAQLKKALALIDKRIGQVINKSSVYTTAAWGFTDQPDFLNQVLKVATVLEPEECMQTVLEIEKEMGRIRTTPNAPRTIDIDILFYDDLILDKPILTLPHPAIAKRKFVLVPMQELAPEYIHPVLNKNISEILNVCSDTLDVSKM